MVLFQVYSGYVDDIRNTDNSWMETVAMNFHDESGTFALSVSLSLHSCCVINPRPRRGQQVIVVRLSVVFSALVNTSLFASHIFFVSCCVCECVEKRLEMILIS